MKKILVQILLILFFVSCSTTEISKIETTKISEGSNRYIANLGEYIEPSSDSVNFLFKIPNNSEYSFYLGETKDTLKKIEITEKYNSDTGITINNLEAEKTYFYKVNTEIEKNKIYSDIYRFTKRKVEIEESRAEWARNAVFYELYVRSFYDSDGDKIGDFNGVTKRFDYLKDLGIDAIWMMPTCSSPSYHGYDITDYYDVESDYGTLEDFKAMIQEAHRNNIKIIIDLVINHTSNEHPWFKEASENIDSKYRDYYVWATEYDNISERGEWGQQMWHKTATGNYEAVFWSGMPDLNLRNPKVREEIKKVAKFWLDIGVDGFRLDAAKHIDSKNDLVNHAWWQEFTDYVKGVNEDAFLVGETWDSNENYVGKYFNDMDSSFNFKLSESIGKIVQGGDKDIIKELNKTKEIYSKYNKNYIDSTFVKNHDMNRIASEVFGSIEKQKLAFSILFTLPGTPFIYYGEELGQKGRKPDENIREPFDWYKNAVGEGMTGAPSSYSGLKYTGANDGISLEEEYEDQSSLYNHMKSLIKMRKDSPIFNTGKYTTYKNTRNIMSYRVADSTKEILVVHNIKNKEIEFELPNEYTEYESKLILKPYETLIFEK